MSAREPGDLRDVIAETLEHAPKFGYVKGEPINEGATDDLVDAILAAIAEAGFSVVATDLAARLRRNAECVYDHYRIILDGGGWVPTDDYLISQEELDALPDDVPGQVGDLGVMEERIDRYRAEMDRWFSKRAEWSQEHFIAVLPGFGIRSYIWHLSANRWEHRNIPFSELEQRYGEQP